jgi:tetratricopeptide (TPR) repeat protein
LLALAALLAGLSLAGVVVVPHLWAEYHYRAADKALGRHRPEEARAHLRHCLRVWPDSPRAHLLAARAARQVGDLDAAERHLKFCRQEPSLRPEYRLERNLCHAQGGDLEEVEEYLRSLLDRGHPKAALILEALAEGYFRTYRTQATSSCLEQWLEREPDNPRAFFARGRVWQRLHDFSRAATDFGRAVELDPENADARLALAVALLEVGRTEEALGHLEHLRERRPNAPEVLVRLALVWKGLGQNERARQVVGEILSRRPDYVPALTLQGQLALETGKPSEAEAPLRRALALAPLDRQANYHWLGYVKQRGSPAELKAQEAKLRRIEKALQRLNVIGNKEMAARPDDPALHVEVAELMFATGYTDLGVVWCYSALRKDPAYGPAHALLAQHFERTGEQERARSHRDREKADPR